MAAMYKMIEDGATDIECQRADPATWLRYQQAFRDARGVIKNAKYTEKLEAKINALPLRDWQKEAIKKIDAQLDRKVMWIYADPGNAGMYPHDNSLS